MFQDRVPLLALLLSASLLLDCSSAQDCVPAPLSLTIQNVTLASTRLRRGVSIKIGSPAQELSFFPRWNNNNTFVYGPECDGEDLVAETDIACQSLRGGLYDPANSTTKGSLDSDYKPLSEPWSSDSYNLTSDSITLADNFTLKDFPIAHPTDAEKWGLEGYDPQNIIGMGPGSTLMSSLVNAGRISARAFGFWYGLEGVLDRDQAQGSFVLGGYDKAKTYGDGLPLTFTVDKDCPTGMVVNIQDILLNFRNGTDSSIFPSGGGTVLKACLDPERPVLMEMPKDPYFNTLIDAIDNEEVMRTPGLDYQNIVLNPKRTIYDGDMSFKFDSNLQITIPNHQLLVPERLINSKGRLVPNATRPVIRLNPPEDSNKNILPVLGRYFFTGAYVLSNQDANEFKLYEANPTSDEDLVAVNAKNEAVDSQATCTVLPTAPAEAGQGDGKDDGSSSDSGLSSGAIAGIAVGVVVPALIGMVLLWWWCMKRKKLSSGKGESEYQESPGSQRAGLSADGFPQQGLPHYIPQEMSAEQHPKVKPVEMP
ncbi:Fc.00g027050.m01.CDS01 [Cosmosporella sp. VM-42]